jgi:anti-sigma factor RsiW
MSVMECHDVQPQLSALVDGAVSASERDAMRAHLSGCSACRSLLQDLERLRDTARALGPRTPPDHIWLEIAGRVQLEARATRAPATARRSRAALAQWIGLAAALVLITIGAYVVTVDAPAPSGTANADAAGGNAPVAGTVEAVAEELSLAMQHYERAIVQLETLAKTDADALDPAVRTTLTESIATIDQAITESRTALAQNPGSTPARESLFEALRRKVVVLQATVTLMNEMRKGNQAGAAEAAAAVGNKRS